MFRVVHQPLPHGSGHDRVAMATSERDKEINRSDPLSLSTSIAELGDVTAY
jgi:hypothetical protein